ncbi:hypothetical protein FIBSPDRAFT_154145 [Athelia psychrophila]|uniref:Uncharacterized protein n=1 Tax=Athelia psychrophila TaxID=1759441 RepID=A0A166BE95_9AGAM|nr:hypothetical protein FIBSPDRAFT_154145 [Fibularhizoctonia sp. CBS 109695]
MAISRPSRPVLFSLWGCGVCAGRPTSLALDPGNPSRRAFQASRITADRAKSCITADKCPSQLKENATYFLLFYAFLNALHDIIHNLFEVPVRLVIPESHHTPA